MPNSFHKRTTILAKSTILLSSILVFGSILGVAITTNVYANEIVSTVIVNLSSSCTMTSNTKEAHSATFSGSETKSNVGLTNFTVTCNDAGGFAIYAVGWSDNTEGNTNLVGSSGNIATATSGSSSYWAMQVHKADEDTGDDPGYDSAVSVVNGFDSENYHVVPSSYTRVAEKSSGISLGSTVSVSATYRIFIASGQPAGTYTGLVKYALAHPSTESCPEGYELKSGVCTKQTITTITNMQEMIPAICENSQLNETKQLKDTRDNELYLVGKLADGKCWMLDNLRLGGSSAITLTSSDSHVSSNFTLPASGTSNFDSTNGFTNAAINTASKNTTTTSYGSGSGKIGVYYNYCAASAGTICTSSNSSNATYDICPKGWRMPTGGSSGEYQALYTAYSSNAGSFRSALSTPLSGYFYNGSSGTQGSYGSFWSSTRNNSTSMYYLDVDSSYVYPAYNNSRYYGYSVRCISQ